MLISTNEEKMEHGEVDVEVRRIQSKMEQRASASITLLLKATPFLRVTDTRFLLFYLDPSS